MLQSLCKQNHHPYMSLTDCKTASEAQTTSYLGWKMKIDIIKENHKPINLFYIST